MCLVLGGTSYVRHLALTHNNRFLEGRSLCLDALFIALALLCKSVDMEWYHDVKLCAGLDVSLRGETELCGAASRKRSQEGHESCSARWGSDEVRLHHTRKF